jgi:2-(1,2-epoxy-1,2-dihydrophenyl)acetyl-CoA isomerase
MTHEAVLFDVKEGIATLSFNVADRLNPLTPELLTGALAALERVHADTTIRVLVIRAEGKAFCVGADLAALGAAKPNGDAAPSSLGDQVAELMDTGGNPLVMGLRELPVPVVCAVQGAVAGGGVGVALAADIVIAAKSAYFYLPFVPALGIVPDMGCAWFMARALGPARTVGLTLLGDRLSAEQAAQWGLIWACVDDAALGGEVARIATRLAALPAHAATETRALYRVAESNTVAEQLVYERERQRELIDGPCFAEGVAAFVGKRRPAFPGRRPA